MENNTAGRPDFPGKPVSGCSFRFPIACADSLQADIQRIYPVPGLINPCDQTVNTGDCAINDCGNLSDPCDIIPNVCDRALNTCNPVIIDCNHISNACNQTINICDNAINTCNRILKISFVRPQAVRIGNQDPYRPAGGRFSA